MLLRIASLLALVGLSLPAARAEQCPAPAPADCCKPADAAPVQERKTPKLPRDTKAPIEITSESASLTRAGDATLEGKVVVRQGDREITAESALYNQETGDFSVTGDVIYREPDLWIKGGTGSWSSDIGAKVGDAEFELPKRPARGSAKEISVSPDGILSLKRVRFTTCPVGRDDWMLKAARITIDPNAEQGTGRNVRLDFMGVPVLYTPYISFPVTAARKTGFLFPDIGRSSKGGFEFATPYYFNLAPNYDLVVTPRLMTRRGVQGAGEFRYLTRTSRGTLEGDFLPGDDLAGGNRSYARLVHVTDFTDSLRLNSPTTHTKTFRQLLGEKVGNDTWIKLGFDIILGITTDQIAGFRHEMFLPSYLSAGVENGIEVKTANGWQRIMKKKTVLYQAQNVPPPISIWQKPFIWIAAICFFYLLLSLFPQGTVLHRFGDHFLLIICGILGILLLGMLFTDHRPTHYNLNLLWLNPLLLVFIIMGWFGERWRQMRWMTALAGALIVLLMWFLSPQQFNVCFVPVLVLLVVRSADNLGLFANFK